MSPHTEIGDGGGRHVKKPKAEKQEKTKWSKQINQRRKKDEKENEKEKLKTKKRMGERPRSTIQSKTKKDDVKPETKL